MTEDNRNGEAKQDERSHEETDSQWEHFKNTLKKLAQVPKEEVGEMRAEREREKEERRAG